MKSAIKRHGGKTYLQPKIVEKASQFKYKRFLDAYCGGCNVLLNLPCEGISEWANDTHSQLTNFWKVLRHKPNQLIRVLGNIPMSEFSFESALVPMDDDVEQAVSFFVRNRMGRQAKGKSYATPTGRQRRNMNEHVSAWWGAIEGLPELHERLRRVEIWNRPAVEAIKTLDGEDLLVYCDPPYMHEVRVTTDDYEEHEMTPEQHEELLKTLSCMQGKFMLSGYRTKLYDSYAFANDWRLLEFPMSNSASGAKTKGIKIECLWSNF